MNELVLPLAIRWLTAEDAFSASSVSFEWQEALSGDRDNGNLWKQVCKNSYPLAAAGISNNEVMDFRRLALGLWDGKLPKASTAPIYTPKLAPKDLFAVVDLYRKPRVKGGDNRRKEMIASWVCPISGEEFIDMKFADDDDKKVLLQGPNPYSLAMRDSEEVRKWREGGYWQPMPHTFVAQRFAGEIGSVEAERLDNVLRLDVTLFRRDNMKSVRILENNQLDNHDCDDSNEGDFIYSHGPDLEFGPSDAGKVARSMMFDGGVGSMSVDCWFTLSPKGPSPGADEEPAWLVNCRQALQRSQSYQPDETDQAALAKIPSLELEVDGFSIHLERWKEAEDDMLYEFENENEMMVMLEGLRWG